MNDTTASAAAYQAKLFAALSPTDRLAMAMRLSEELVRGSRWMMRRESLARGEQLDDCELLERWAVQQYGPAIARGCGAARRKWLEARGK